MPCTSSSASHLTEAFYGIPSQPIIYSYNQCRINMQQDKVMIHHLKYMVNMLSTSPRVTVLFPPRAAG